MKAMNRALVVAISVAALMISINVLEASTRQKWPVIQPMSWSGEIDVLVTPNPVFIYDTMGQIVYRIYCSSRIAPTPEPEWLVHGDNYGGDFECLLTDEAPGKPARRATLLNYDPTDPSPYHFNEASFGWEELVGRCQDNREWGRDRTFSLRGMRLRIHVTDVKVEQYYDKKQRQTYPIVRHVTVQISAEPDAKANTSLARKPKHHEPTECD